MYKENKVEQLISYLFGTSISFNEACAVLNIKEEDLTEKDWTEFDQRIFRCDGCGWWEETCERNDLNGDALCDDCISDEVFLDI